MRDHFLLPCKNIWFEKYIVWVTLLRSTFEIDGNGQESYTGQWTQQNTTSTWGRLFPSFGGVLMVKPRKWYEFEEILFPLRMFWWQRQWSQVAERDIFVPSRPSDVMIVKLTYHLADKLTKSVWKNLYINLWNAPFSHFPFALQSEFWALVAITCMVNDAEYLKLLFGMFCTWRRTNNKIAQQKY